MNASGIDIDSITSAVCFLLGILLLRICDGQFALQDQMRGQALVGMRAIIGVPVAS